VFPLSMELSFFGWELALQRCCFGKPTEFETLRLSYEDDQNGGTKAGRQKLGVLASSSSDSVLLGLIFWGINFAEQLLASFHSEVATNLK